jgi:phosphoribosyl-ATP pyrophosphohydrolase
VSDETLIDDDIFAEQVLDEVLRARKLFPGSSGLLAALIEEVGELARALMDESDDEVWTEATQVAAMALRLAVEGDPSLDAVREAHARLKK